MPTAIRISQGKQKKIDTVKALVEKLSRARAFFITEYRGLTHQQLEQLRKSLKKVQAEYVVAKNRLVKIAINQEPTCLPARQETKNQELKDQLEKELENPTATLFAFGDEISAIRELANFIKSVQLPKIKIGIFAGKLATEADFLKLATLPTRDVLLATLANRLKSPISGLHYSLSWNLRKFVTVLDNIKEKKPSN